MNLIPRHLKGPRRPTTPGRYSLDDEVDAYLSGTLLALVWRPDAGQPRPWLWLNAVAHGDVRRLEILANDAPRGAVATRTWRGVQGVLAQELLTLGHGDPEAVAALQRSALVPLELALSSSGPMPPERLLEVAMREVRLAAT